jgi:hypothetical protein
MKKKRRNLPPHIVLPSGMWRFVKRSKVKAPKKRVSTKRKLKRRFSNMPRRYKSRRVRSIAGGAMSRGVVPVSGILASALIGAGAATLAEKVVPQFIPYQGPIIGFAVGGIGGAAGAFARDVLKGTTGTQTIGSVYS